MCFELKVLDLQVKHGTLVATGNKKQLCNLLDRELLFVGIHGISF